MGIIKENGKFVAYGYVDNQYTFLGSDEELERCAELTRKLCTKYRKAKKTVEKPYGFLKSQNQEVRHVFC